ncbi:MAG TPA: hypothetical protein VKH40_15275 [Alloacidobacterium sp.]|nr:hypothetical protein [Alloacidobacterium sp.]
MPVETRKQRLRRILRETLDAELPSDVNGRRPRLQGPWATFFEEGNAWDEGAYLNRDLYRDLTGQFDNNTIREILLAAANIKISRTTLSREKIATLQAAAVRHGFQIAISKHPWILRPDHGKGGWANQVERAAEPDEPGAVSNVYIAVDATLAETGQMLDEAGEDDLFGALLGIPACCREAFDKHKSSAAERQYDFIPYVLENTPTNTPCDWRLNYTAQYFGYSLLSFFPCSFRCPVAAAVADRTFSMLARCDADWARRFVALQQTNVLYTETRGLHLFRTPLLNESIAYTQQDLISTEATDLTAILQQGDRLEITSRHAVQIYRGSRKIATIEGRDISMCAFY